MDFAQNMNTTRYTSSTRRVRLSVIITMILALSFAAYQIVSPPSVEGISSTIVISQIYGGGGNAGATYTNDFIELFNRGASAVSVAGWTVQYASATGTTWQTTALSGSIPPGGYYLVQEAQGAGGTTPLPTPDATGSIPMSATAGKVALVNTTTALSGSCPTGASIIDFVGFGSTANCSEGSPTATLSNTTAALRNMNGCTDTDSNSSDFTTGAPAPRNSASPTNSCGGSTNPSGTGAANPSGVTPGAMTLLTVTVTPGTNPPSTGLAVTGDLTSIGGSASQMFFDDGSNGDATPGDNIFSFQATVAMATTPGMKSLPVTITDAEMRMGSTSISLSVVSPGGTRIHDIQGASHISPLANTSVSGVPGIVTALLSNGFYMQDPMPDANDATSEAIFVFTSSAPTVSVGDSVLVSGTISEFRAGGSSGLTNLTTTEISGSPTVAIQSTGNPLPPPIVIGTGGRIPPSTIIEDDASGDVETGGVFDPASDGIDFYESLEAMRVQVNNPVVVGPSVSFGEIPVVGDDGANASVRTTRGGVVIRSSDFNPERIILDDTILSTPSVNVGDHFSGPAIGVMDYSFGNFKLNITSPISAVSGGLAQEITNTPNSNQLTIATFNVENLDPGDGATKFNTIASEVVNNLKSPDLITVEEVQDNNGATNDGTVDATVTINTLISAIQTAGGPTYQFRQINPVNNQDGGEPGGNIRVVFLFRTDRGLSFIDRPGGDSTTATTVVSGMMGPELSFSPGRVDPNNAAWSASRKPLAGEFTFNGRKIFVIGNHFNSKGGDDPLFGHIQPPVLSSEVKRLQQAQIVHDFVNSILALDSNASVVVLGDLNDFEFSNPLTTLKGTILHALVESLPQSERYSYVFDGNSQELDHILASDGLVTNTPFEYDVVHLHSEFAVRVSDHDPSLVRFTFTPTAIELTDFSATDMGGQILLQWQTGMEIDNLGFNVYREEAGSRVRITPQILAGSALVAGPGTALTAGRSYSWWDVSAQAKQTARYWLEEIDLKGRSIWHGPAIVKSSTGKISAREQREATMLSMLGRDNIQESPAQPLERRAVLPQASAAFLQGPNSLANLPALKISIKQEGWYRITRSELLEAGLDPRAEWNNLQMYVDGREIPISLGSSGVGKSGSTTAIEFYAVGLDSASTDVRTYWLVAGQQPGLRIPRLQGKTGPSASTSFPFTVEKRDRTIYFSSLRNGDKENFFGAVIGTEPVDQVVRLQHPDQTQPGNATLEIALQGVTQVAHSVSVQLNGSDVGLVSFNDQTEGVARLIIPQSLLVEGDNQIRLASQGGDVDVSLVDYLRITYQHTFAVDGDALRITAPTNRSLTVEGFSNSQIRVIDITNSDSVQEIAGTVKAMKNGYAYTFTVPGSETRNLLAFDSGHVKSPAAVRANTPSNWRRSGLGANLVIIAHSNLLGGAQLLKEYRENQGLSVALVDVEDIYDEFSFGHKNPLAIRDFLSFAKSNWRPGPGFVLFFGDASLDPKNYLGRGDFDLVPTKLLDTQFMETASDDWLADFGSAGLASMSVGRLPVRADDEGRRMISKIIGYEQNSGDGGVLLVSDISDGFNFEAASDRLKEIIPSEVKVEEIFRGRTDDASARKALLDSLSRGQKIVNYSGHGSLNTWRGNLLNSADALELTNGDHLPLFVMMTCLNGYFQDYALDSLGESLMKAEQGGAVAVWASSGLTIPSGQFILDQEVFRLLFDGQGSEPMTIGEITSRAKTTVTDLDVRRTWILLGDPTTRIMR